MAVEVTPQAIAVFRRALEVGGMDPAGVGIRVSITSTGQLRTAFAEEADAGERTFEAGGIRLFVPSDLAARETVIDVEAEHDQIVLR